VTNEVRLTLAEGIPLAHAMVSHLARMHDIRALLIKGPILHLQGLRRPRESGDVDVLCAPSAVDEFVEVLTRTGWAGFNEDPTTPVVVRPHARAYFHERWPCGIDVHDWFPGCFAPADSVFDALWARRDSVELAGQPVDCTDVIGSAIIHGLHLLRTRDLVPAEADRSYLIRAIRAMTDAELRELAELAATTGAADALGPILDHVDMPMLGRGEWSDADRHEWELRVSASEVKGLMWMEELRSNHPTKWPRILWRALTFDERALYDGPGAHATSVWATTRLIIARFIAAARYLPNAARTLLRLRRQV
jgi:hypothetical protein